ncbi:hypothetical protein TNCT_471221 [Trichonephila clavata]|uniref:Uncharacterized protein n=1 Tax=Trichonephila clavata TaxID=2740835 RepID=A0A8X6G0M6_TRICU|nr:hypothetical protein TNCT_471221 [Trichonephila clavata]
MNGSIMQYRSVLLEKWERIFQECDSNRLQDSLNVMLAYGGQRTVAHSADHLPPFNCHLLQDRNETRRWKPLDVTRCAKSVWHDTIPIFEDYAMP